MAKPKAKELEHGCFIVKPPFFVREIKLLRSGAVAFTVEKELKPDTEADRVGTS